MVIHSIVSLSDIFCNMEQTESKTAVINGGVLELSEDGRFVKRLYSTDPRMYLDKRYMPSARYKD